MSVLGLSSRKKGRGRAGASFAPPDIFADDLSGVTLASSGGLVEFQRGGVGIGLDSPHLAQLGTGLTLMTDPTPGSTGETVVAINFKSVYDVHVRLAESLAPAAGLGDEWWVRWYMLMNQRDWQYTNGKFEQHLGVNPDAGPGIQVVASYGGPEPALSAGYLTCQLVNNVGDVVMEGYAGGGPWYRRLVEYAGPQTDVAWSIEDAVWWVLERRIRVNSDYGVADGEYELWAYEAGTTPTLRLLATDIEWYGANNGRYMRRGMAIGTQLNSGGTRPEGTLDLYRYLKRIAVSTQRIGP